MTSSLITQYNHYTPNELAIQINKIALDKIPVWGYNIVSIVIKGVSKMSNPKLGESWYIFNDADGECTEVQINDITEHTIELVYVNSLFKTSKRFFTEYVNFAGKVDKKVLH